MNHSRSHALFVQAQTRIPGGVNSPVRAFRSVGGEPFFVARADGPYLFDVDGHRYIDYVGSWGPMIVGHNHPAVREAVQVAISNGLSYGAPCAAEVTMAETIARLVPSCEMVRMVNSGTEATLSAIRLARGATGRNYIVKFRRLLPRPRRLIPSQRRQRHADPWHTKLTRGACRAEQTNDHVDLQRFRCGHGTV